MRGFWKGKGLLVSLLLALLLVFLPVFGSSVFAATTQYVSVNATPAYVTISNSPSSYGFGVVQVSTNYSTSTGYFTITNGSTVNIDITISCNATWAGGSGWTHSDAGTPGADTAAMSASPNTGAFNIIVKNSSPNDLYTNTGSASLPWELRLATPTSFSDGVLKTNTITLTATAA